jgi:hypothetical protein
METTSTELTQRTLFRLLFDRESREQALRGDWDALGVDGEARIAFEGIDFDELQAAATKILGQLLHGKHGQASGLAKCYARSLAQVDQGVGQRTRSLMEAFVASDEFRDSSDVPFAGMGCCPEEAFYRFLLRETGALPDSESWVVLRHEFLEALLQALTVSPSPSFIVQESSLHREESRYWIIESYPSELLGKLGAPFDANCPRSSVLYATSDGQYVTGLVPGFVEGWLEHARRERVETALLGVTSPARRAHAEQWLRALCQVGLIR